MHWIIMVNQGVLMKWNNVIFSLCFLNVFAFAGLDYDPPQAYRDKSGQVGKIVKRADRCVVTVQALLETVELKNYLSAGSELRRSILDAAAASKKFRARFDPMFLTPDNRLGFLPKNFTFRIARPLTASDADMFLIAKEFQDFLVAIKRPEKTALQITGISLEIENSEASRAELLKKIGEDVASLLQMSGQTSKISVVGANSPVKCSQIEDFQFELWIDYTATVEIAKTVK